MASILDIIGPDNFVAPQTQKFLDRYQGDGRGTIAGKVAKRLRSDFNKWDNRSTLDKSIDIYAEVLEVKDALTYQALYSPSKIVQARSLYNIIKGDVITKKAAEEAKEGATKEKMGTNRMAFLRVQHFSEHLPNPYIAFVKPGSAALEEQKALFEKDLEEFGFKFDSTQQFARYLTLVMQLQFLSLYPVAEIPEKASNVVQGDIVKVSPVLNNAATPIFEITELVTDRSILNSLPRIVRMEKLDIVADNFSECIGELALAIAREDQYLPDFEIRGNFTFSRDNSF